MSGPTEPVTIDPGAVYTDAALRLALGLSYDALARARKSEGLRYTRRGGRFFYTGKAILDWLGAEAAAEPAGVVTC